MEPVPIASVGLRQIRLLEGLEAQVLEALAGCCRWRRFLRGQAVLSRAAPDCDLLLLVGGSVRVHVYTAAGRRVTFRDLHQGDTLGEVAALDGGQRSLDAEALSDVLVAILDREQFQALLEDHPVVARRVMASLVNLVRLLTDQVVELSTLGVQNRIHADLLRLARAAAPAQADGGARLISPAPKHMEIASRVSTTREQVTRELSTLSRSGLLERAPEGLRVNDLHRLEQMVESARRAA